MTILIVTPLFEPAPGGASTYYQLLVDLLLDGSAVDRVIVVTGAVEGQPVRETRRNGRLLVRRMFPPTATSARGWKQYGWYVLQNLVYLRLPAVIRNFEIDVVLAHSSLHNYPNAFASVIRWIARWHDCRLVADVRDCLLPRKRMSELGSYDAVIACSKNVEQHLRRGGGVTRKIVHIPVIQEPIPQPSKERVEQFRHKHDLPEAPYACYVGIVKEEKGVGLLLEAFQQWVQRGTDVHLILAGPMKADADLARAINVAPQVHALGRIPRDDVFALQAGASLCANLSTSEGMPRSCLEAIALDTPTLLPDCVPEFKQWASDHVISQRDPQPVSRHLQQIYESSHGVPYPLERHLPDNARGQYLAVLRGESPEPVSTQA